MNGPPPPLSGRRRGQRGSSLVAAIAMVTIMALIGLATLALVDVQTVASSRDRTADRSFNLAEAVVNLQTSTFSHSWPTALPFTCTGAITSATGGTASADSRCVQAQLVAASLSGANLSGASWTLQASDGGDGRIRVRVAATTPGPRGSDRAVEAMIGRRSAPAVPLGYATIANNFSGELGLVLNQVTNIGLLRSLLGDTRLVRDGRIGLRCGLLNGALQPGHNPNVCVTGALSIAGPNGLSGLGDILGTGAIVNYGHASAATPAVMASLRSQAVAAGTVRTSVAHGAACLAGVPAAGAITYIDRVGAGDGTCTITLPAGTTTATGAVIVERGRVLVRGSGSAATPGVLRAVLWAMNRQGATTGDVITLSGSVQVRGAVLADSTAGTVGLRPGPNPGTPQAVQAEQLAQDIGETEDSLAGLNQQQLNDLASLIAAAEAARATVASRMNARPYPQRSCPILTAAPNHAPLITALSGLETALDAVIAAATPLPGTAAYVSQLQAERAKVVAERGKLPNPSPCVLLGLDQILDGLFDLLGGVLTGVTGLLTGPTGLLTYVTNLVTTLTGTLNGLVTNLDTILSDTLGGLASQGMIIHDPQVVAALRADGGAGVLPDSFRQVAAR